MKWLLGCLKSSKSVVLPFLLINSHVAWEYSSFTSHLMVTCLGYFTEVRMEKQR